MWTMKKSSIPNPIMAPTIEWVVDTGNDFQVAKLTHNAAARSVNHGGCKAGNGRTEAEMVVLLPESAKKAENVSAAAVEICREEQL